MQAPATAAPPTGALAGDREKTRGVGPMTPLSAASGERAERGRVAVGEGKRRGFSSRGHRGRYRFLQEIGAGRARRRIQVPTGAWGAAAAAARMRDGTGGSGTASHRPDSPPIFPVGADK